MDNKIIIALALIAGGAGIYYFLKKKQTTTSIDYSTGDFNLPRINMDTSKMKEAAAKGNLRLAQGSDLLKFTRAA